MALSGFSRHDFTPWNYLQFSWTAVQSIPNNSSVVTWELWLFATDSNGALNSSAPKSYSVTVGGKEYTGTTYVGITSGSRPLASGSTEIAHSSDGVGTFYVRYWVNFDLYFSGSNLGTQGSGATFTLDRIAGASTLTASNGTLGTAMTMAIGRANNSFRHKIQYVCGSASGYVLGSASATSTAVAATWTPPLSLASQNTTGTSVSVTLMLYTYSGNTLVGTTFKTITCAIPASVKPTVNVTLDDINGADNTYGTPVQGLSRIKITVSATAAYGSPIKSYTISANGATYNAAEATTGTLKTSGDSPVTVTVTDARGRTGSWSYTMSVKAYDRPSVTGLTVHRCDEDGTENDQGKFVRVTFSAAVTNIGGLGKNAARYTLRYKKTEATDITEVALSDLTGDYTISNYSRIFAADSGSSYNVEVMAQDSHTTTTSSTSASTAFTLMNWSADGTSLSIGKVAERPGTMEVALDMYTTGTREQRGNRFCLSTPGEASMPGYVLMARISITAANADTPITFVFTRRQAESPMTVHVQLKNSTATASELASIRYEGTNYGAFLVKAGGLIWDLYVPKGSSWDTITLQDWWTSHTMESRVTVAFPGTLVDALPGDYYRATPLVVRSILDCFMPVGFIIMLYSHADPNTMYPGTEWERITNAFPWFVDSSGTIGTTGGEKTVKLTVDQIPAHSHGSVYSQHATGTKDKAWYNTTGSAVAYGPVSTGEGEAHNNMPPYIQLSAWRRTA